jgi:hypothetical protein
MSGLKMMKRTRGIEEFEFIGIRDALKKIQENKKKREEERAKKDKSSRENLKASAPTLTMPSKDKNPSTDVVWELKSNLSNEPLPQLQTEKVIDDWASKVGPEDEDEPSEPILGHILEEPEDNISRQTNVLITVSGWVAYDTDDHTYPFSTLEEGLNGDQYTLIWETKVLQELGSTLSILVGEIASFIFQQGLQATLLPVLMGALTGPMWLMKLTYLVDNPWGNAMTKAEKAGRLLADTLIAQVQSNRPVTLVGFSLGARLIFYCLLELASRGAYGIVESVYMFGTPCVAYTKEWDKVCSVVSGRIVNGFTANDMLLGVLYRASVSSYKYVPGLTAVQHPGVESVELTEFLNGHMEYQSKMPKILKHVGFAVNAEEFEDQDAEVAKYRQELEDLKTKQKELKEQEKIDSQRKRQEEKEAEMEMKRVAKEQELERQRLTREAEIAEKKRKEDKLRAAPPVIPPLMLPDELAAEELNMMAEMEHMMESYWQPREIPSTLPPLVVGSKEPALFESAPTQQTIAPEDELSDF